MVGFVIKGSGGASFKDMKMFFPVVFSYPFFITDQFRYSLLDGKLFYSTTPDQAKNYKVV